MGDGQLLNRLQERGMWLQCLQATQVLLGLLVPRTMMYDWVDGVRYSLFNGPKKLPNQP